MQKYGTADGTVESSELGDYGSNIKEGAIETYNAVVSIATDQKVRDKVVDAIIDGTINCVTHPVSCITGTEGSASDRATIDHLLGDEVAAAGHYLEGALLVPGSAKVIKLVKESAEVVTDVVKKIDVDVPDVDYPTVNKPKVGFGGSSDSSSNSGNGEVVNNGDNGYADNEASGFSQYDQYRNTDGSWKWPDDDGFVAGTVKEVTIPKGTKLDRYGGEHGFYLAPKGTSIPERSLAPGSAAESLKSYEVVKPLPAKSGEAASAFSQLGGGTQILTPASIKQLIKDGYLKELP